MQRDELRGIRWAIIGAILLSVILAAAFVPLLTLIWSVRPQIMNQGWVAIGTAVYAGATVGILVVLALAAWYARGQVNALRESLRHAEAARHAQILTDLSRRWDESPVIDCRKALLQFRGNGHALRDKLMALRNHWKPEYFDLIVVANFFEDLGVLVGEGILPIKVVKESLGSAAKVQYTLHKPFIKRLQEKAQDTTIYGSFEELIRRLNA